MIIKNNNCKHKKSPTSYKMQSPEIIFKELDLKKGDRFLDVGCGAGDYSIHASEIISETGKVYALDREKIADDFRKRVRLSRMKNIEIKTFDIKETFPIESKSIDVCFIATVLHAIDISNNEKNIFNEIKRVLKPKGRLAIVECKKEDLSFGPPLKMRIAPEEIEQMAKKYGFKKFNFVNLGFNYLIQFENKE